MEDLNVTVQFHQYTPCIVCFYLFIIGALVLYTSASLYASDMLRLFSAVVRASMCVIEVSSWRARGCGFFSLVFLPPRCN